MSDRIILNGGAIQIVPMLVLAVSSSSASTSTAHRIIGRAAPEVTLAPMDGPTGTIELLFADADSAQACVGAHQYLGTFDLICETVPAWSRHYVVEGTVVSALDPQTLTRWTVSIGYRAVPR